jgi:molecular chaperone GrpE
VQQDGPSLEEALQQISVLNRQLAEANDKTLRALAEADNTRKRAERDRQDTAKFSVANFARSLLSVSDNLRRALNAIPQDQRESNPQLKNIYVGVEATERELLRAFESNGIKKVEPATGDKFDPNMHEVIYETPPGSGVPGTIMQVIEPGYVIHERLLRPARVAVAKAQDGYDGAKLDQQV